MDPFKDIKVRQAMKLCDRPPGARSTTAFFGFGDIGNDQFGKNGPPMYYNADLPQREYDPERAKSLLAEAGFPDGIDVTLELSPACGCQGPEGVNTLAAQAFQQQAKAAGINFEIQQTSNIDQWNILAYPFSATWWSPGRAIRLNWFTDRKRLQRRLGASRVGQALPRGRRDTRRGSRAELWQEIQAQFYEESGHIIWGHYNLIDGLSPNVQGAYATRGRSAPTTSRAIGLPEPVEAAGGAVAAISCRSARASASVAEPSSATGAIRWLSFVATASAVGLVADPRQLRLGLRCHGDPAGRSGPEGARQIREAGGRRGDA